MFYRCSSCSKILTEFDANFTIKLKGSVNKEDCKCASCIVNNGKLYGHYWEEDKMATLRNLKKSKPSIFKYIISYVILLLAVYFANAATILDNNIENTLPAFLTLDLAMVVLNFLIIVYIIFVANCVKDFHLVTYEGYEYEYYETKYNESSKAFETESKTGTRGGDNKGFEKFFLFLTFPVWGVFRYVYMYIKYRKITNVKFTKEMIGAYKEAIRTTEKFKSFDKTLEEYNRELGKYNAAVDTIKSKYAYLDGDRYLEAINKEIKKLKKPACSTIWSNNIHHGMYDLVCISKLSAENESGYWQNVLFIVNGIGKKIIIPSISKEYAVYITNKNKRKKIFNVALSGSFDREKGIVIDSTENPSEN